MGVDVMQFNLHKTFSTPHGGGGPGAGPVAVRSHLAEFLPNPRIVKKENTFHIENLPHSIGKVKSYFGNYGVLVRALTYILHHGSDGLKRVSRVATLNANYIKHKLSKYYDVPYPTPSFHECVLSDKLQQQKNVKTLQISKALIDEGFHPPTMYFPLVVSGAILIEPTETESIAELDKLIEAFIRIAKRVNEGESFDHHPAKTIVKKIDEVRASRTPVLTFDDRA
jgi:glycine dehydrogenase subunit 2